ncbi:hypothetical protein M569_00393, partial [Genlisea aurea]
WMRNDYMVRSWIHNSISKELVSSFTACSSAHDLWKTLESHYGQLNNSLFYQVQFDISNLKQGDLSVAEYSTRLNAL